MGDFYSDGQSIYVQYFCDVDLPLSKSDAKVPLTASVHKSHLEYDASCYDSFSKKFSISYKGVVHYPFDVTVPLLSHGFAVTVIEAGQCHSVKYDFRVFVDGVLIDTLEVFLFIMPDSYFDKEYPRRGDLVVNCIYNASSQSCVEGSQTLPPRYYDFVEIGTSGFDTLIEQASDWHVGLSVEVLKDLQDTLPDRAGVIKVNAAIGDEAGWKDIYFFPKAFLEQSGYDLKGENNSIFGVASLDAPNPLQPLRCLVEGRFVTEDISMQRQMVRMRPVGQLLAEYGVAAIGLLKTDTEGYDVRILKAAISYCAARMVALPRYIDFENNLNVPASYELIDTLISNGYRVYSVVYGLGYSINNSTFRGQGVVYAELAEGAPLYWDMQTMEANGEDASVERTGVLSRISHMLSGHLPFIRAACREYLDGISFFAEGSGRAWIKGGFYCSLYANHGDEVEIPKFEYITHDSIF
jgi:hypothetical protein